MEEKKRVRNVCAVPSTLGWGAAARVYIPISVCEKRERKESVRSVNVYVRVE